MTKIEWTNKTWNPIVGCSKCSPGCDNCYAEIMAKRVMYMTMNSINETHLNYCDALNEDLKWRGNSVFCENMIYEPFKWKKPCMIFVCSMGDLFHEGVQFENIREVLGVIHDNPRHTFQILTKRPERMAEFFKWLNNSNVPVNFPNMWLGVTAENQEMADKRIPILLQIPAAIRFVSIEPMLGRVDVMKYLVPPADGLIEEMERYHDWIDWVICGGETGSKARPMHPDWVRSVRDQCKVTGIPFFLKSWGEWISNGDAEYVSLGKFLDSKKHTFGSGIGATDVSRIGKKYTGHLIDGIEYHEFPNK